MKKQISILSVCLFSLFVLFGCSDQDKDVDKSKDKEKEKVATIELAEVARSIFYAPLYVAMNEGFFEEEGIEISLTTVPGGDKTMTTLLSGGADMILVGAETSIYVAEQGAKDRVVSFANLTQTDGTFLVAREEIEDFEWSSLAGATFLGQRVGGMPQMVGEYVLKKHDIDPDNDLEELIQNIDFANIGSAFASGTGDFVQLFEPTASILEKEGVGHVVASFGKESGVVPYTTFMTKASYIDENPDVVAAFTRAIYRAQQWVYAHNPEEIAASITPFFPDADSDIVIRSVQRYLEQESFAHTPLLTADMWDQLQVIMMDGGQLDTPTSYDELVDQTFALDAMKGD